MRNGRKRTAAFILTAILATGYFSIQVMAESVSEASPWEDLLAPEVFSSQIEVSTGDELVYAALNCADGETITLRADIKLVNTLIFDCGGKSITLDLAGHRLDVTDPTKNGLAIEGENCVLIISDSQGTGRLHAECGFTEGNPEYDTAGIRVLDTNQTLIIDGAEVRAKGGDMGAGIGGGLAKTGTIIVKSGLVTAEGGRYGAGIGGGLNQFAGNIVIEGGDVKGIGGDFAAGIGTGGLEVFPSEKTLAYLTQEVFSVRAETATAPVTMGNRINIYNGTITAIGGINAAGIGSGQYQSSVDITISDGRIDARGGGSGAGIGSGSLNSHWGGDAEVFPVRIVISGGNVKAAGGDFAAGIGIGEGSGDFSTELQAGDRNILIEGGNVIALGGSGGAGIGGGAFVSGGTVSISPSPGKNVYVEATGGGEGAGIGGGKAGQAGVALAIGGGSVEAKGGENAAGIGTGGFSREHIQPTASFFWVRKKVVLSGGQITALGGNNSAAIGGGAGGAGVDLKIYGEPVVNAVSSYKTTIGAGEFSYDQGSCTISGGNIRINNEMGPQPKNGMNRNLYLGVLTLVTDDDSAPVTNAMVEVISDDIDPYKAVADDDGIVAMYLPADMTGLSVLTDFTGLSNVKPNRTTGKMSITEDNKGAATLALPNAEPIKILDREHTYYIGDSNTFQLPYSGGLNGNTSFSIIHNESKVDIDKRTGLLTIPVQIESGDHNFTVLAWKGEEVTDSAPFTLHVKETLTAITPSIREIATETDRESVISFDTQPSSAEIAYSDWRLIYGSEEDSRLTVLPDENGNKTASFNSKKPGVYVLMAAAQDVKGNKAWDTVHITVAEPSVHVFGSAAEKVDWETVVGNISAWSIDRTSPETAELVFLYDGEGPYGSLLLRNDGFGEGAVPEGEFVEDGFLKKGKNAFTIKNLEAGRAYDYFIKASDERGRDAIIGKFIIPDFLPPDILPPALTDMQIERQDSESVSVYFTADEPGKYYYVLADENGQDDIDSDARPLPLLEGRNRLTLESLVPDKTYVLKLLLEDQSGNTRAYDSLIIIG